MPKNESKSAIQQLWVGKFDDGSVVVYDPSIQETGSEKVKLFLFNGARYKKFVRIRTRNSIKPAGDEFLATHAISAYEYSRKQDWESMKIISADIKEKRLYRFTHCWNCHTPINEKSFDICPKCNWITCACGACGCNFKSYSGNPEEI